MFKLTQEITDVDGDKSKVKTENFEDFSIVVWKPKSKRRRQDRRIIIRNNLGCSRLTILPVHYTLSKKLKNNECFSAIMNLFKEDLVSVRSD